MFRNLGALCACCGLDDKRFLSLDHIKNDGWKDMRFSGWRRDALKEAKNNGWDKTRFQVLCYNCNMGKAFNGGLVCPHKAI